MLPPPIRGFRSKVINALLREVKATQPLAGANVTLRRTPDGTFINAKPGGSGGGSAPFDFRWRVTLETVTADDGATTYNLHVQPGSLWRDEGAGAVDLNVAPDGSTVTVSGAEWLAAGVTASGALYVVEAGESAAVPYPLVYGDPTSETRRILLRVADLSLASSGVTLVQRQVGDALTGGASGLQPGPLEREDGDFPGPGGDLSANCRFVQYMGAWAFNAETNTWVFAKAVRPDGTAYPPARILPAGAALFRRNYDNIGTYPVPVDCDWSTPFLSRFKVRVSQGIDITPPQSDTDTGSVSETTRDLIYFTDDITANASTDYPLTVQVAEANEATAYDS